MKKILFLVLILFLSLEVSFAFSLNDIRSDDSNLFKREKYSFNSTDLIKDYNNATQYDVQILHDGKPVGCGEKVTFFVNGMNYTRFTDCNGIASLNINLEPGQYIVYGEYKTFKNYNNILVL